VINNENKREATQRTNKTQQNNTWRYKTMKCQKCGINEVNFHYTSNVNGCVTETNLCYQCAAESGFDIGQMFGQNPFTNFGRLFGPDMNLDAESLFDKMYPMRKGINGFVPLAIPVVQSNTMFPFTIQSNRGMIENSNACDCGCGTGSTKVSNVEVDEEMSKRRELNALMRAAIEIEDFEKAAELRDQIKDLEARRDLKCDSETTSQDSPTVQ